MRQLISIVAFLVLSVSLGVAQEEQDLRVGKNYLDTKVYSAEEDQRILDLFEGLRVADVSDGMDRAGLADVGLMDPSIHPLWKDTKEFTHRIIGIAVTVRYVPSNERHPSYEEETAAFDAWVGKTYSQITPEPFTSLIREGTVLVIEEAPLTDVGTIGSNNIM
ncbi:RraA family protein, partial [bacterium]|nr:RraA family protein [bacterium]